MVKPVELHDGEYNQAELRRFIAEEMMSGMLTCPLEEFLDYYSPFQPSDDSIEAGLRVLGCRTDVKWDPKREQDVESEDEESSDGSFEDEEVEDGLLEGEESSAMPPNDGNSDSDSSVEDEESDGASLDALDDGEPSDEDGEFEDRWWDPPSQTDEEEKVLHALEDIVEALHDVIYFDQAGGQERIRHFSYKDCSRNDMTTEFPRANFKVDAVITSVKEFLQTSNPISDGPPSKSKDITPAEIALIMKFKMHKTDDEEKDNRLKLASAANHIMNDDPRRTWMYGITIEDTSMSLWYFSRSHSVKSESFDFTKDLKTFVRIFLSFLYATPREIGYDPTVSRVMHNNQWCYVYELGTENQPRYFRTIEPLFSQRGFCMTGRKTRVWRAIEVEGLDGEGLDRVVDGQEVAVKDVWLEEGSRTEMENQKAIFESLSKLSFSEEEYPWAEGTLGEMLMEALQNEGYKDYFVKIACDKWLAKCRPKSASAKSGPHLLCPPSDLSEPRVIICHDYQIRQQYRLVYSDVGQSLDTAPDLETSITAAFHTFIALVLLYLAGWVHRDVSAGNIILVKCANGSIQGKLNDLEYAKKFDKEASTDPKTGTPPFMAIEIHLGRKLYCGGPKLPPAIKPNPWLHAKRDWPKAREVEPLLPPKHTYQHDSESLIWVILWFLMCRVAYAPGRKQAAWIYATTSKPSSLRRAILDGPRIDPYITDYIHPDLEFTVVYLEAIFSLLRRSYFQAEFSDFSGLYRDIWGCLCPLIFHLTTIRGITFDDSALEVEDPEPESPESEKPVRKTGVSRKRPRKSKYNDGQPFDPAGKKEAEGSSQPKKQKQSTNQTKEERKVRAGRSRRSRSRGRIS